MLVEIFIMLLLIAIFGQLYNIQMEIRGKKYTHVDNNLYIVKDDKIVNEKEPFTFTVSDN